MPGRPENGALRRTLGLDSPVGRLTLTEQDGAIVAIDWTRRAVRDNPTPLLARAKDLLGRHFDGEPVDFDLPLSPRGTAFQQRVWRAMRAIPYGDTVTYGELARRVDSEPRAIGGACGANPIPIVVPCHRVVAASGAGGYSGRGGLKTKALLLEIEAGQPRLRFASRTGG
jgi:methylated-DNA-[protein]-cysteine S-methyltransferase